MALVSVALLQGTSQADLSGSGGLAAFSLTANVSGCQPALAAGGLVDAAAKQGTVTSTATFACKGLPNGTTVVGFAVYNGSE